MDFWLLCGLFVLMMPSTSGPQRISDSDCGVIESNKEDVEALVNEKLRIKNNFNYKEKIENMKDYIKRLKQCIRWFQQLDGNYVTQLEKLKKSMMKAKEDKLNTIIMELRKNLEALQEKFTKEEVDKLATDDRRLDLSEVFYVGQSVRSNIVDVSTEMGRITLSLKQSLCCSTDASFIQEYFLLEEKVTPEFLSIFDKLI
ncbi:kinesin-3 [Phtheirospermum japonicum]|uniref:Kinesin-3 n=1 Tax=Phtheirospermum japonicum TaxID=374723 RepID=A0A830CRV5_9LAMI|nr:kinesin-3 [Phtheirospermum japonicum]